MTKQFLIALVTVIASAQAQASGFVCKSYRDGLAVQVYNHTTPSNGTRSAAVMILSNMNVANGNKTIAVLRDLDQKYTGTEAIFDGNVDLRYTESSRKGEWILGTKLGYVQSIKLAVAFGYARPTAKGQEMPGTLIVVKRNGEKLRIENLSCTRYLKI